MEPKTMMDMALIPSMDPGDIGLGSSEKGNSVTASKPRKKSMTSLYLKFFETAPDGKSRSCKFCKQNYSIATATGNLGRHLNHRHPGYDRQQGDADVQVSPRPAPVTKKPQPQVKAISVDFDHLNWLLFKWLIGSSLPLSVFEDEALGNCFKFLNSSVKFWPREKVQSVVHEVFRTMREDIRAFLDQVHSRICITLDFWTSYEKVCYMSITSHWIDENWSKHEVLLDISHVPYGGADIYHTLLKVIKFFNIDKRMLSCVYDSTQSAILAGYNLKEDLDGRKVPFCYMPCAARALNLIIEDGLKPAKPAIAKVRDFILQMNATSEMGHDFRQLAGGYQDVWKLPLDASTRWSGEYTMLDVVRKAPSIIETVMRKHEDTLGTRNMLSHGEKNVLNMIHAFLEPFHKTTNNLCTSKSPTIGLILFFMDHVLEMITACTDSRTSPDWLKSAAGEMAKKAWSYSSQVHNIYAYMAAILDPRIKVELLPESLNSEANLEEARNHFIRSYSTSHFPPMANGYNAQDNEEGSSVSFAEEIARKRRRVSMSTAMDELSQYLAEPPAPIATDILEWWKVNSTRYPRLSLMARDYLAIQATSVAPDELFSSKGDEIEKQRKGLSHSNTQAILCIRSWTQSGIKLKYRSTEIDYERLIELATPPDGSSSSFDRKLK